MVRSAFRALASAAVVTWIGTGALLAQAGGPHGGPNPVHVDNGNHGSPDKGPSSLTVSQRIDRNPQLASRLEALLPAGMTLDQAAAGFKTQGQFIAALHVAHNLNISFVDLKTDMTGTNHDSLGQAIHALKPTADASAEVKKADREADADLKASKGDHTGKP
jgi:hypothetical protein